MQYSNERFEQDKSPQPHNQVRNRVYASLAMVAVVASGVVYGKNIAADRPECSGSQVAVASSSDTLNGMLYEHVDVEDGSYVNLRKVDRSVHRPSPEHPAHEDGLPPEINTTEIEAGDRVKMPEECR